MNFGQAIPLLSRPKYEEGSPLAPARDTRNNSFLWKKASVESRQQNQFGQAIQKLTREVAKQRRRVVGGFIPTPPIQVISPFQFYNIANASVKPDGTPSGQDWQTFQMRDGIYSARSLWGGQYQPSALLEDQAPVAPGYETRCVVTNDGLINQNYVQPTGLTNFTALSNTVDTLCFDPQTNPFGGTFGQIILDPNFEQNLQQVRASFWLQVIDTQASFYFYAQLWGRMWAAGGEFGRPTQPFPTGTNIIPIAVIQAEQGFYAIEQIQDGNIVGNYSYPGNSSNAFGNALTYRGDYTNDSLHNQYVYPGDVVTNGTYMAGGQTLPISFICTAYQQMVSPPTVAGGWRQGP